MEWQAWHFLNTSRPAAGSPPAGGAAAAPLGVSACACGSAAAILCITAWSSLEDGCATGGGAFAGAAGAAEAGFGAAVEVAAGAAAAIWCWCCGGAAVSGAGDELAEWTAVAGAVDDD
jgi:hypothetical protein